MKKIVLYCIVVALVANSLLARAGVTLWHKVGNSQTPIVAQLMHPTKFLVYNLDEPTIRVQLFTLSNEPSEGIIISLPIADGTFRDFRIWQNSLLPAPLATKYPALRTFTGEAIDNRAVTVKIDFTEYGFHAMIYDGDNTSFVDPVNNYHDGNYMVHYRRDETKDASDKMKCSVPGHDATAITGASVKAGGANSTAKSGLRTINGYQLRTYRLALACDHQYAEAATGLSNPSVAQALSKMVTTMNRVNGIYERELAVTMVFIPNEDTLIFLDSATDPYSSLNENASGILNENQIICDSFIGNSNYDLGHVFNTGGGGLSVVGCACNVPFKASSETGGSNPVGDGFDVDYVSHEMGHEFGAEHPFNDEISGNCNSATIWSPTAYEPGSGSTIMAYAGICPPDDLQPHSDPYFHAVSLLEMQTYITGTGIGASCPVVTPTGNKSVALPAFAQSYIIPYLTPFELTGPSATDSVADTSITYCWEEWNLGDIGQSLANTHVGGPIFRSYLPTKSTSRFLPRMSLLLDDSLSNAGIEGNEGEKVPDTARFLTFRYTVRDIYNGLGCVLLPDDTIHIDVIDNGEGFALTGPAGFTQWNGGTTQNITWTLGGSNNAPINCDSVDITMSADGGNTWAYPLGRFANTGAANIFIPDIATDSFVRIMVKASNNIFFTINAENLLLNHIDSAIMLFPTNLKMGPDPVRNTLSISYMFNEPVNIVITDAIGREVYKGTMESSKDIQVNTWNGGVYIARFYNSISTQVDVRKFVVGN